MVKLTAILGGLAAPGWDPPVWARATSAARALPGLERLDVARVLSGQDGSGDTVIVEAYFDDLGSLWTALTSPEESGLRHLLDGWTRAAESSFMLYVSELLQ